MNYNIIRTGSKGNAVVIENQILIDCGVSYKAIKPYVPDLKIVLLTHGHTDHFRMTTISRLAEDRPTLRFGCGEWLVEDVVLAGVSKHLIDIYAMDTLNTYKCFTVEAFALFHNVPNCGYKIGIDGKKVLYATDTNCITTEAKNYDLYLIEANYDYAELKKRIEQKIIDGVDFIYDYLVPENHLSRQQATDFIMENAGPESEYQFLHMHGG